jgi:hypothetical protein
MDAKMVANQIKADATLKQIKEEMMVRLEAMIQNKENMMAKLDAHHERMMARTKACLAKTETTDLEANQEATESESEHEKVPKEVTAVETFGALKEWYEDRHLAVGRRRQPKKRAQGKVGRRPQMDNSPCRNGTAQVTWS